jgi:hypothetical protein
MLKFIKDYLRLPTPSELGKSNYDALPSKDFGYCEQCFAQENYYTWEDHYGEVKKLHPIKYFVQESVGDFIRYKVINRFKDIHYWFVSHVIPSRRYHVLDLRQPCKHRHDDTCNDCYRWGWKDVPEKMLYAIFNLLEEYLQEEEALTRFLTEVKEMEGRDVCTGTIPEEASEWYKELVQRHNENLSEAKRISHWWKVEREQDLRAYYVKLYEWSDLHKLSCERHNPNVSKAFDELNALEQAIENKTDEMITRLMKIRRSLWV